MKKFIVLMMICTGSLLAQAPSCDSAELKGAVAGINQSAPMQVDNDTTLTGAVCENGELIYKFKLVDSSKINGFKDAQLNIAKNVMQNIIKENYCGTGADMQALRSFTNAVVWSYDFADGKKFTEIRLSPADCK